MKKIVIFSLIIVTIVSLCSFKHVELDMSIDYSVLMMEAAAKGDINAGKEYERLRELKKQQLGMHDTLNFDDLYLLAKIVEAEAGSYWIEYEHKKLVASVVMNRVDSPEFPNTIHDVFYQEGQYAPAGTEEFDQMVPSKTSVKAAFEILMHGSIAPKTVVFQANFKQGSGTYRTYKPKWLGTTYFCYSSYPELYM